MGMNTKMFSSGGEFLAYIDAMAFVSPGLRRPRPAHAGLNSLDVQERLTRQGNPVPLFLSQPMTRLMPGIGR